MRSPPSEHAGRRLEWDSGRDSLFVGNNLECQESSAPTVLLQGKPVLHGVPVDKLHTPLTSLQLNQHTLLTAGLVRPALVARSHFVTKMNQHQRRGEPDEAGTYQAVGLNSQRS